MLAHSELAHSELPHYERASSLRKSFLSNICAYSDWKFWTLFCRMPPHFRSTCPQVSYPPWYFTWYTCARAWQMYTYTCAYTHTYTHEWSHCDDPCAPFAEIMGLMFTDAAHVVIEKSTSVRKLSVCLRVREAWHCCARMFRRLWLKCEYSWEGAFMHVFVCMRVCANVLSRMQMQLFPSVCAHECVYMYIHT